ncbi:MAG: pilin [Candidatus Moraniibacteriota bacterium]
MLKIKNTKQLYLLVVALWLGFFVVSVGSSRALTTALDQKCQANAKDVGGICVPTGSGLSEAPIYLILSNLFSWLLALFTVFAIGAFVLAGIQYSAAAGDEDVIKKAKETAKNAGIGIAVGLSGFVIVRAISAALTGQSWFF